MADSAFRINRGITLNPQSTIPTSPTNGDVYYDSTLGTFVFYDNGFWINLASRQDVASAASMTSANFTAAIVQNSLIRITGATAGTIHGVSASTDGNMVVIYNNTNALITIAHQSGSEGTAANRIVTHTAQSIVIPAGMTFKLVYDSSQSRWVHAAPAIDGHDKLFEDRNILLTQGGLITYTGTTVTFTEALALEVNQREAGGSPVVISLGSTTRNVSATGRMIYAVIDRVAGTAVVTDDATTLPAAVPLNQEVFLIAKRVDAGDGTKRIYWRNGMALNEGQTVRLGASGSGSGGSGTGDDINTLRFKASFTDTFAESATSATTAINSSLTTGVYSAANALYRLSYDASRTVTGTGTSMTLSGTPAYTVAAGDMLIVGSEARRITVATTQTSYTLESAFSSDPSGAAACVSQAVHTNDVRAHTENSTGLAINALISDSVSTYMLRYEDSAASGDAIWDFPGAALVAASTSADNSSWSSVFSRVTALSTTEPLRSVPVSGSQFRARFFSAAVAGSGAVNILYYKTFLHEDSGTSSGTTMDQAYCLSSGAGTEINCSVSSDTGKTRVTTTWAYATGVNPGTQQGQIMVMLDGKVLPRFIDNTVTASGYFKEISSQVIELDADYSGAGLEIDIKKWVSAVDTTSQNSTNLSYLQDMSAAGFQGFVDESTKLTAINGAPGAGQFRTFGIAGRASIPDLTNDLRARMGIDRIQTQSIYQLQNEFGPSGELVFAAVNDDRGLIRFVGSDWANQVGAGASPQFGGLAGTYVEVVFYGTGLNFLTDVYNINWSATSLTYNVDAGADVIVPTVSTYSSVLHSRNYASNVIIPIVSGLSLGLHTVKLRCSSVVANGINALGFEILNESSSVKIQPGTAYLNGKKLVSSTQSAVAYNSGTFDSVLQSDASTSFSTTRGARVLSYIKSDGTIGKSAYLVNAAQANLSSADHTYEEVIRTHHTREFGANRADDFSTLLGAGSNRAFTLDDGTTTLIGANARYQVFTPDAVNFGQSATTDPLLFTFVGTGLDVKWIADGVATNITVSVDAASIGTFGPIPVVSQVRTQRIVSGLPYGTHTVKFTTTSLTNNVGINQFIVYGPKKPTLPTGAVELADYNVLADYVANSGNLNKAATGTLRKVGLREMAYVGTWTVTTFDSNFGSALPVISSTGASYVEYTFFGTGIEHRGFAGNTNTVNYTYSIDGITNLTGAGYSANLYNSGTGLTFTGTTGVLSGTETTSVFGPTVSITGIPLGSHKLRITYNSGTQPLYLDTLDIVTPIHSYKSNIYADLQNTLPVGSCGVMDSRKISAIKEALPAQKAWTQAIGIQSDPTTTSNVNFVPLPDMSLTIKTNGGPLDIQYNCHVNNSSANSGVFVGIYVDGILVTSANKYVNGISANYIIMISDSIIVPVSAGTHKVDLYWHTDGATTASAKTNLRILKAREL